MSSVPANRFFCGWLQDVGKTSLIHSIESKNDALTALLLEKGANIEAKDHVSICGMYRLIDVLDVS